MDREARVERIQKVSSKASHNSKVAQIQTIEMGIDNEPDRLAAIIIASAMQFVDMLDTITGAEGRDYTPDLSELTLAESIIEKRVEPAIKAMRKVLRNLKGDGGAEA